MSAYIHVLLEQCDLDPSSTPLAWSCIWLLAGMSSSYIVPSKSDRQVTF